MVDQPSQKIVIEYFEGVWGRAYPLVLLLEFHGVEFDYKEIGQVEWARRKGENLAGEMAVLPIVTFKGE